jgi:hypothetical protein
VGSLRGALHERNLLINEMEKAGGSGGTDHARARMLKEECKAFAKKMNSLLAGDGDAPSGGTNPVQQSQVLRVVRGITTTVISMASIV